MNAVILFYLAVILMHLSMSSCRVEGRDPQDYDMGMGMGTCPTPIILTEHPSTTPRVGKV
jgi:hypothetical protein